MTWFNSMLDPEYIAQSHLHGAQELGRTSKSESKMIITKLKRYF